MSVQEGYITTTDGVRLFFKEIGKGEPIIIVPNGLYYFDDFRKHAASNRMIFYDVRNRGFSDTITDRSKLEKGIWQDVADLEAVRTHVEAPKIALMGHSYIGLMVALYAMNHPDQVSLIVQLSPSPPNASIQYPPDLAYTDPFITGVMSKLAQLQTQPRPDDPVESCKQFWRILGPINVFNQAHAAKIDWGRCELPNERNFMQYWSEFVFASIQKIELRKENLQSVQSRVLVIHGDKDRSAPYGGARDWVQMWPNARLLTVPNVAHAPWIEAPDLVHRSVAVFLQGEWPHDARGLH